MPVMAKKRKTTGLYADVDDDLKRRLIRMAAHHRRKIGAELSIALQNYLDLWEKKEGLPPIEPAEEDE